MTSPCVAITSSFDMNFPERGCRSAAGSWHARRQIGRRGRNCKSWSFRRRPVDPMFCFVHPLPTGLPMAARDPDAITPLAAGTAPLAKSPLNDTGGKFRLLPQSYSSCRLESAASTTSSPMAARSQPTHPDSVLARDVIPDLVALLDWLARTSAPAGRGRRRCPRRPLRTLRQPPLRLRLLWRG